MLKKSLLLFTLILPVFCFCQTEKGVWAFNANFNFQSSNNNKFTFIKLPKWQSHWMLYVGYFFRKNSFGGINFIRESKIRDQSFATQIQQNTIFIIRPYFRRYFGESNLKGFGIIEGQFVKTKEEFFFFPSKNEKTIISSALGLGLSYHFNLNVAFELVGTFPFIEKKNSYINDAFLRTNFRLFLNTKKPYNRDIHWKSDYLGKGNIIIGLFSDLNFRYQNVPLIANIQPRFSTLFSKSLRLNIAPYFNEQDRNNRPFYNLGAVTSLDFISLLSNDDWFLWELGASFNYNGFGKGQWNKSQTYFTGFGIRFAGQKNIFFDANWKYELNLGSNGGDHSNLFFELGFETFFYGNLSFQSVVYLKSTDITERTFLDVFSKSRRNFGVDFGFNYYLLRNKNQSN